MGLLLSIVATLIYSKNKLDEPLLGLMIMVLLWLCLNSLLTHKRKKSNWRFRLMKFVTHKGRFHADEVTAFTIASLAEGVSLKRVEMTDYKQAEDEMLVDIGRVYEAFLKKFDHHHMTISRPDAYAPNYASAGLIWKHYGKKALKALAVPISDIETIHSKIDKDFIWQIDANDDDPEFKVHASCSTCDHIPVISLSHVVAMFNSENHQDDHAQYMNFMKASEFIKNLLVQKVEFWKEVCSLKRSVEKDCVFHDGYVVTHRSFDRYKVPYLFEDRSNILYFIQPSYGHGNEASLLALPTSPTSRELKKPIERPVWFKGFIHKGKFIAGGSFKEMEKLAKFQLGL